MKTIKYTGPCAVVEVEPLTDDAPFRAERHVPVEVPERVADALLEQSTWEAVEAPTPPARKPRATKTKTKE